MPVGGGAVEDRGRLLDRVEDTGSEVITVQRGDLVVAPFAISENTCAFCREHLHTSCAHPQADFWDGLPDEGGQAEAVRVPLADGTLVKLPVTADSALIPSLLTLSDVFGTGYHAAVAGGVNERTRVTVIRSASAACSVTTSTSPVGPHRSVPTSRN